jgi:hypothetical protein
MTHPILRRALSPLALSLLLSTGLSPASVHAEPSRSQVRSRLQAPGTSAALVEYKGTVTYFKYTMLIPTGFPDVPGCMFRLDSVPATDFPVFMDGTTQEAMCRLALDAFQTGLTISAGVATLGGPVQSIAVSR